MIPMERIKQALSDLWDQGYCGTATYNDVDANTEEEKAKLRAQDVEQALGVLSAALPKPSYWVSSQHGELKISYLDESDGVYKWRPVYAAPSLLLASLVAKPVSWRYRFKRRGNVDWSAWLTTNSDAPPTGDKFHQVEMRPLIYGDAAAAEPPKSAAQVVYEQNKADDDLMIATLKAAGAKRRAREVLEHWFCEELGLDMDSAESDAIIDRLAAAFAGEGTANEPRTEPIHEECAISAGFHARLP